MAGVVWVNATNLFDAGVGFGGYRESGFGREGGREGVLRVSEAEGLGGRKLRLDVAGRCRRARSAAAEPSTCRRSTAPQSCSSAASRCGRTASYSRAVLSPKGQRRRRGRRGQPQGHPQCRRRARAPPRRGRGRRAHNRAQIALLPRREPRRPAPTSSPGASPAMTGVGAPAARGRGRCGDRAACSATAPGPTSTKASVHAAAARRGAGHARAHRRGRRGLPRRGAAARLRQPGRAVDRDGQPPVIAVPSERHPLAATDFYQVLETSDVPAGVVNIVTGDRGEPGQGARRA